MEKPTTLRIVLSSDGKHSVLLDLDAEQFADDGVLSSAIQRASRVFDGILETYGWQYQARERAREGEKAKSEPVCEDCGEVIKGFTSRDGVVITAERMVESSRRRFSGHVYCGRCRRKHTG